MNARKMLASGRLQRVGTPIGFGLLTILAIELLFGRATIDHPLGIPIPVGINSGFLLLGAVQGMLYALLAFGLILVYRANRIINFAHAGLGLVPGVLGLLLVVNLHWPYPAALAVMLIGSAIIGGVTELAMRRFSRSPRLIATVVTIGFAQIFVYFEVNLPNWVGGSSGVPYQFPTPYSNLKLSFDGIVFTGDYLAIVVASLAICAGIAAFLRFSRIGVATRAAAENSDRALLLGVPVARLSTIVWVIAGVCSGVAIFLQAPVTALPTGGTVSPLVLLYGLAAAVIARMESLPVALGAGMGIGMVQTASFVGSSTPDDAAALMLPVILIALLFQRRRVARAFDSGVSSFKALQEFRPIPAELRRLPEVLGTRIGIGVLVGAAALGGPWILGAANAGFLTLIVIAAMISVSLVVLSGWAGQISLGQYAFAGVGAAIAGGLAVRYGVDFFATLAAAAAAGALIAVLIGIPALRVPGMFLSVVTLGFAATVQYGVLEQAHFSWLLPPPDSYIGRPDLYGRFDTSSNRAFYYVALIFLVLAYASARSLRASRSGRIFIGLRDNVRAAQSYGVNATASRLAAFALSGAIAAIAGALSAYQSQVSASSFSMDLSLTAFLFAVVGGLTSLPGAVTATVLFETIQFIANANIAVLATGVGTAIVLFVLPGGLAQAGYQMRDNLLRWVAARRGIHVPSLVADSRLEAVADPADQPEAPLLAAATTVGASV
jgi:branched-chain amino acid transport system permease protein